MNGVPFDLFVSANLAQKFDARHRLHIPVRDDQAVGPLANFLQGRGAVRRFIHIFEAKLLEQVADDSKHRLVVIDDEDVHALIDAHDQLLQPSTDHGGVAQISEENRNKK